VSFGQVAQAVVVLLAGIGVYSFTLTAKDSEVRRSCSALCAMKPDYAARNRQAPDFELPSMDGQKISLKSFRGKTVILNFWTKTCRPCLEEMPSLADLGKALLTEPNIALVTITTDESAADARATLESIGVGKNPPFVVLIDPDGKIVQDVYGTKLFPETWFIDPNGVIRARFDGPREWDGPLPLDLARSFSGPLPCEISYATGEPSGPLAGLCRDLGGAK
jgi:peroxiredoxin